ncbi:MAG: c-type cytochrome biogenesis protein CcmI [Alphaproteobacteria bacterium]|nr:c-type cytochrome biogenesis protein CcmI [Alphaproteobacteria bacterium]
MTEFFLFAVPLAVMTVLLLALPLWRGPGKAAPRAAFDLAVFRDQLSEIDRDLERGLLGQAEADAARLEIQRRILAATADKGETGGGAGGRWLIALAAGTALVLAAFVYIVIGMPGMPDFPHALRADVREATGRGEAAERLRQQIPDLEAAVAKLAERLKGEPNDLRGWTMLGRTYMVLGRYTEAAEAFAMARRAGGGIEAAQGQAEALLAAKPDAVSPEMEKLLTEILAEEPGYITAHYHLGLAKAQRGDFRGAAQSFTDVLALSPPGAEWIPGVKEQLGFAAHEVSLRPDSLTPSANVAEYIRKNQRPAAAAPAPTEAPAAEPGVDPARQEMIRGMVERLAKRLQDNPNDAEGWRMLSRSYEVLGEIEKAKDAKAKADALAK